MEARLKDLIKAHLAERGVGLTLIEIKLALFEASDAGDPDTEDWKALDVSANAVSEAIDRHAAAQHAAGALISDPI